MVKQLNSGSINRQRCISALAYNSVLYQRFRTVLQNNKAATPYSVFRHLTAYINVVFRLLLM